MGKKQLIASLINTGFGKTEASIDFIIKEQSRKRSNAAPILYLLPDYENIKDVRERLEEKAEEKGIDINIYTFGGKEHISEDFYLIRDLPLCELTSGKYSPGCAECPLYPSENHTGCEYHAQFDYIKMVDVVFAVHHCAFIALKHHFSTIVIDESLEGVLFKTFDLTEKEWNSLGIEWNDFPTRVKRICQRTCPLYQFCKQHRENKPCLGQSEIKYIQPKITRPPNNDLEYFYHIIFGREDVVVTSSWNFYKNRPHVAVFNFLPELDCNKIIYNSATTSEIMIKKWFFINYNQSEWELSFNIEKPQYTNPLITFNYFGSKNQAIKGILGSVFKEMRNNLKIPANERGLVVVKKENIPIFKKELGLQDYRFASYPLVGLDYYKDCSFVILTQPFRYDVTTQYLMSDQFGYQMVNDIIDSYTIQAIGRIRIGNKPWLSNTKILVTYFDFNHKLFPNKIDFKEMKTMEWIKSMLVEKELSANKLWALLQLENKSKTWYLERNRKDFFSLVRKYNEKLKNKV